MRVLVLYTLPPQSLDLGRTVEEFELSIVATVVGSAIKGSFVRPVRGRPDEIMDTLRQTHPDVIFNLCEAPLGRPDFESYAASLFEWLGFRFTGCRSATLALCRHKDVTGRLLRASGISVPGEIEISAPRFPCVVKPASEDGSVGIHSHSLCRDPDQLHSALSRLSPPVIVQDFIPGREFTVFLWGQSLPDNFFIRETTVDGGPGMITYETKWSRRNDPPPDDEAASLDPRLAPSLEASIVKTARATWALVRARHYLRIDIRLDSADVPHVLDVNPNPAISPRMGFGRAGWRWEDFIRKLIEWA